MRLIDADTLDFEKLQDTNDKAIPAKEYIAFLKGAIAAEELIKNAPTIDAEPIVHGHWEFMGDVGITKCSNCGWSICECLDDSYKLCPHCGAKMDEKIKE